MTTPLKEKRRFPRIVRPVARADAGDSMGWAVSYSDLLMVLLAFFILYFKFGEKDAQNILRSVVSDLDSSGQMEKPAKGMAAGGSGPRDGSASFDPLTFQRELTGLGLTAEKVSPDGLLMIHFPDHFFKPGEYQLGNTQRASIERLLTVLAPHKDKIEIVFVGHADATSLHKRQGKLVDSNLVLSNLRAARAVELAILSGFEPRFVSSEGVGEYRRASRSLSVRIGARHK